MIITMFSALVQFRYADIEGPLRYEFYDISHFNLVYRSNIGTTENDFYCISYFYLILAILILEDLRNILLQYFLF